MIPVHGLFEAHLTVTDLDRSIEFYRAAGLRLAHVSAARGAAFFWIGPAGHAMLGLWAAGTGPQRVTLHVAFRVNLSDVIAAPRALRAAGIEPLDFDGEPTDEPVVIAWMPAASVFFRDPDGHLLECIAMLPDESQPDRGIVPWHTWELTRGAAPTPQTNLTLHRVPAGADRERCMELLLLADASEQQVRAYFNLGELYAYLDGNQLLGVVLAIPQDAHTMELKAIAIDPPRQSQGLGRQLLNAVLDDLRARGVKRVLVGTANGAIGQLAYYQKAGFRLLRIERDYFGADRGYPPDMTDNGIALQDMVWMDQWL